MFVSLFVRVEKRKDAVESDWVRKTMNLGINRAGYCCIAIAIVIVIAIIIIIGAK